jgi:fluoride exporter
MSAWAWIGVAVFGGAGAIARFVIDGRISDRLDGDFPFGTLAVNLSGALLLGLLTGLELTGVTLLLAGTAALGSYTTFSTWMLESQRLVEDGAVRAGAVNAVLSVVLGVAAAALGRTIGTHL